MNETFSEWSRPRFEFGGGDAMVLFAIYGRFAEPIQLDAAKDHLAGTQLACEVRKVTRSPAKPLPFTDDALSRTIGRENPKLWERLVDADECIRVQGEVNDPPTLDYLRETIGMVTAIAEAGGLAVMNPQAWRLYDVSGWRSDVFSANPPRPAQYVIVIPSPEDDGTTWFHTRGLRMFGRPDLSVRGTPREFDDAVCDLLTHFIHLQVEGGRIHDGEVVRMASLPRGMTCRNAGSLDDPDFNNVHMEILWPEYP